VAGEDTKNFINHQIDLLNKLKTDLRPINIDESGNVNINLVANSTGCTLVPDFIKCITEKYKGQTININLHFQNMPTTENAILGSAWAINKIAQPSRFYGNMNSLLENKDIQQLIKTKKLNINIENYEYIDVTDKPHTNAGFFAKLWHNIKTLPQLFADKAHKTQTQGESIVNTWKGKISNIKNNNVEKRNQIITRDNTTNISHDVKKRNQIISKEPPNNNLNHTKTHPARVR
jgi:hypothetical protein